MPGAIATAYVKLIPTFDGQLSSTISKQLGGVDGKSAGSKVGKGFEAGVEASASGLGTSMSAKLSKWSVAWGNIISNVMQNVARTAVDTFFEGFNGYADYEQLAGGVEKIFDQADISAIMEDANKAYVDLNMSANQYLEAINSTGAAFAQTMGDQKGYDTARRGMLAIADYASGTGRSVDELTQKFALITRSTSSYQSIADQFSGILPATSKDFLEQAKACGYLSDSYKSLTDVPIDEYQEAVAMMLEKGTADMGLAGNTAKESTETITGSIHMLQAAWQNMLSGMFDENADVEMLFDRFADSLGAAIKNILPRMGVLIGRVVSGLPDAISKAFDSLPDVLAPALEKMFGADAASMVENLRNSIDRIGEPLGNIVGHLESIVTNLGPVFDVIAEIQNDAFAAGLEFVNQILGALDGVLSMVDGIIKLVKGDQEFIDQYAESMNDLAYESIDAERAIDDVVFAANNVPEEKDVTIKVNDYASDKLGAISGLLGGITSKTIDVAVNAIAGLASGGFAKLHASGGFVTNGPTYLGRDANGVAHIAGEAGREWIKTHADGTASIVPIENKRYLEPYASDIASMIGVGSSTVYNISIDGARINDDPAIRDAFITFMGEVNRKKAMNVG